MKGGHQKKKSSLTDIPLIPPRQGGHISSFSTASSLSRPPLNGRSHNSVSAHSPSPPASAYFNINVGDEEVSSSKDASAHFAYSTTLRRHHTDTVLPLTSPNGGLFSSFEIGKIVSSEGAQLWSRITGDDRLLDQRLLEEEQRLSDGHSSRGLQETPSSLYAHLTVDVSFKRSYLRP